MYVAIGVWGAVMEHIAFPALGGFADQLVQVHFFPLIKHLRLFLDQIGFHGKRGFGEIECLFVIHIMCLRQK